MALWILHEFDNTFCDPSLGFTYGVISAAVVDEENLSSAHRDIMLNPFINVHGFILHDGKHTQLMIVPAEVFSLSAPTQHAGVVPCFDFALEL